MDPETGETQAEPETGEVVIRPSVDDETGEHDYPKLITHKQSFRIPKEYTSKQKPFKSSERRLEFLTAVIFLVPSMIFFYPILGLPILFIELIIHSICHRQNKKLKDKTPIFYRSPLHLITKEFCGDCKIETSNHKITKIQDIRNDSRFKKYGLNIRNVVT